MYIILLNKVRFYQISCSGRSGTLQQYRVSKWYEIIKSLGTPALACPKCYLQLILLQVNSFWACLCLFLTKMVLM